MKWSIQYGSNYIFEKDTIYAMPRDTHPLIVSEIIGNIHRNKKLKSRYLSMMSLGKSETLTITRFESDRSRIRRRTDKGSDLGIVLNSGTQMRHGDVIVSDPQRFVIIQQEPETVMTIRIKKTCPDSKLVLTAAAVGHIIGNMHRPIATQSEGKVIAFPLQSNAEFQVFEKLFSKFLEFVNMSLERIVFLPVQTASRHEA
jgi:urease accessory protein UreE